MADVQDLGLTETQKIAAYDDRAARGKPGVRSAKLTGTLRAYYRVVSGVVVIQDINQLGACRRKPDRGLRVDSRDRFLCETAGILRGILRISHKKMSEKRPKTD
ncbi:MAG TPA: hypothetical protein VF331_17620, partial [Polyangiales bacterium]